MPGGPPRGVALRPLLVSAGHRKTILVRKPENLPLDGTNNGAPPKTDSNGFCAPHDHQKEGFSGWLRASAQWSATSAVVGTDGYIDCTRTVRYCCFLAKVLAVVRRDAALFFNPATRPRSGGPFRRGGEDPIACLTRAHTNNSTAQRSTHSQPSPASQGMHKPSMARYMLCPPWPLPPPHLRQKSSAFRLDCASRGVGVVVVE